jgi:hypothetical protein
MLNHLAKLSTQQKAILRSLATTTSGSQWSRRQKLRKDVTPSIDWDAIRRENGLFLRNRVYYRGPRPPYDENRKLTNKVHASISRALRRLVERGLVEWQIDRTPAKRLWRRFSHSFETIPERVDRYPVLTQKGKEAVEQLTADRCKARQGLINMKEEPPL